MSELTTLGPFADTRAVAPIRKKTGKLEINSASAASSSPDLPNCGEFLPNSAQRHSSKVDRGTDMTSEGINLSLPHSCRAGADTLDHRWRLRAYVRRYSRPWRLYGGEADAGWQILQLKCRPVIEHGRESTCPFFDFLWRVTVLFSSPCLERRKTGQRIDVMRHQEDCSSCKISQKSCDVLCHILQPIGNV